MTTSPKVGIIMGSQSDWPVMRHAAAILEEMGVPVNAGLMAAAIIALNDAAVAAKLDAYRAAQTDGVAEVPEG